MLNVARGGLADNDANEVAMKPVGEASFFRKVITAIPEPCRRKASRKAWDGLGDSGVVIAPIVSHDVLVYFRHPAGTMGEP